MTVFASMRDLRILLLMPDGADRQAAGDALRAASFARVRTVGNARAALGVLYGEGADILVCTRNLALVRRLRTDIAHRVGHLPMVAIARQGRLPETRAAFNAGINAVLVQPLTPAAVEAAILRAISDRRPYIATPTYRGPDRRDRPAEGDPALRAAVLTQDEIKALLAG